VFLGWEGIMAQRAGFELNAFCPNDFKVPYGYSPVLVAHPDTLRRVPGRGGGEGGDH
jgi:NitT/TauT family transport system substrate-binding protein